MNLMEKRARAAEIDAMDLDTIDGETMKKLNEERKALDAEIQIETKQAEDMKEMRKKVAADTTLPVIKEFKKESEERKMEYNAASKEYRSAFLNSLVGKELSVEERAAFVHTTLNTTAPLPTTMLNEIWDMVSKQHAIMGDITIYRTGTILEVIKHTAIVAGAAKVTLQGVANDDEQNTFVKVALSGKDFSKHVEISYAMAAMSVDSLEQYLISEIAANLGEALADDTITTIKAGIAVGSKVNTIGVKVVTYKELAALFGKLKKVNSIVAYVNNASLYNYLVAMEDTTGRPIFQPSVQAGAQGVVIGAQVKIEESLADHEILVGDPKKVICNMVQDILIEQDKNIKTHTNVYAGYARAESVLMNDTSFALLTVKQI